MFRRNMSSGRLSGLLSGHLSGWYCVLAGVIAASPVLAEVPTYPFVSLHARSNIVDGYQLPANSSFNSKTPALSDDGTIAFTLIYVGAGDPGLFVGSRGVGSVVYSGPNGYILSNPSINADGDIAFDQSDFVSDGIFVYDAQSGNTTLRVPPTDFDNAIGVTLTDNTGLLGASGAVGFRASSIGGARSWRLADTSVTTFASETGGVAYLFTPVTSPDNRIAGKVRLGSTSESAPDEIRRYNGPGSFTVMAADQDANGLSPLLGFDNSVAINGNGDVAFISNTAGGRGVFRSDGSTITTIATEDGVDVSEISFFPPAINNDGLVAFRGRDGAGLYAIFVGDGTGLRRVIGEHDLVETDLGTGRIDQHDNSVTFGGAVAINNHGDIAFNASLTPADNNQVEWGSGMFIAFASTGGQAAVPAASSWGVAAMLLALLVAGSLVWRHNAARDTTPRQAG